MKTLTKRLISLLLCVCLVFGNAVPVFASEIEARSGGQFALAALTADGIVIAPTYVSYGTGETIAQALMKSSYSFTGLEETGGWIQEVQGVSDSYSLFYDENGYDLTAAASTITALCLTTKVENYSAEYLQLIKTMASYNASTNGVKDFADAQAAYETAELKMYTASKEEASQLAQALSDAMEDYEKFISGELVTLTLNTGRAVNVSLTGQFGNTYEAENVTQMQIAPGEYSFDLSDGGINHVRGSVTVDGNTTLTAELPTGQWLASMELGTANGADWEAVTKLGEWTFVVPDYSGSSLYPYFVPGDGVDTSACAMYLGDGSKRVWKSNQTVLARVIESESMNGTVLELEARREYGDYEQYQTYPVEIIRVPSLSSLEVYSEGTKLPLTFDPETKIYDLTTTGASVDIMAASLCSGTSISVNSTPLSGGSTSVTLENGITAINVAVAHGNGQSSTYTVNVQKLNSVEVTIATDADSIEVINSAGASIAPVDGVYHLVPGESYTYVTTSDEYYHTSKAFTASAGLHIDAPAPDTSDYLQSLSVKAANLATVAPYDTAPAFDAGIHEYTYQVGSNETNFGIIAVLEDAYASYTMTALYEDYRTWNDSYSGMKEETVSGPFKLLVNMLGVSGVGNTATLRIHTEQNGVTYYQDYILTAQRKLQINEMQLTSNGKTVVLNQDGGAAGFSKFVLDYTAEVGQTVPELQLAFKLFSTASGNDNAVKVTVRNADWSQTVDYTELAVNETQTVTIPLNDSKYSEDIQVILERDGATTQTYTVEIKKQPPAQTSIFVDPADALVYLTDDVTGLRVLPDSTGAYTLNTGRPYTYVVTKYGYITQQKSFTAGDENQIRVSLEKAANNTLKDISVATDYLYFRGNEENNGITDTLTPIAAEDTVINWGNKIGEGTSGGGVGSPIIIGGDLYTYAGGSIFRIDKETGEILASAAMDHASSFSITPPAYGEGMVFIALANGGVQAFNAQTLESLWVYADVMSGQPNCPVIYKDGYIYTGFWNAEEKQANYVCISVTDENPSQTKEEKLASWTYTHNGFYWAGAYVADDYLLVTTDDGSNGYTTGRGSLLSLDTHTGMLIDELVMPNVGDLRSSICYDNKTDAYYFTSKGGDFYSIKVNGNGSFQNGSLKQLHLTNGTNSDKTPPMSTSTPVVYNGRAYIGVSGISQFGAYSGHNITVIDLNNWKIAYTVPTQGYPQTSGLLTTAYESSGYVYVYFLDNYTPGKLRVIRDTAGQNAFDTSYSTTETYSEAGKTHTIQTGYVLFTPSSAQAQYAICSPIVDEYGNLYFKNDSGYFMSVGSKITELTISQEPGKLTYKVGEVFDGTGMKVTAKYANGLTKDVTKYVKYSSDPLTAEDTEFTVTADFGKYQLMYQNKGEEVGAQYHLPSATIDLTINSDHVWDDGVQTKAPTCTEDGEKTFTCSDCGETRTEAIPATGTHTWDEGTVTKEPSGTEAGIRTYTCSACGATKEEPFLADGEHTWDEGTVSKEPTCLESGVKTFVCLDCGEIRTAEIPSAGAHSWDAGKVTKEPSMHAPGEKLYTCTVCGEEKTEEIQQLTACDGGVSCPGYVFSDWVAADHWAHDGMDYAVSHGLMNGVGTDKFNPDGELTRAMLVTILWRYAGSEDAGTSEFTDVPQDAWYAKSVAWAAKYGIVNGIGDGKFGPDVNISREQIATILYRYAGYLNLDTSATGELSKFQDGDNVSSWAKTAMQWATAAGVINGSVVGDTYYLMPTDNATRAQASELFMNYIERILK